MNLSILLTKLHVKLVIEAAEINLNYRNLKLENDQMKINYDEPQEENVKLIAKNDHHEQFVEHAINRINDLME
jgi:hypothetical protein